MFAAAAGLTGGVAIGLYLASRHGAEVRSGIVQRFRLGTKRLEHQLKNVENQLRELERSIQESRRHFAERVRSVEGQGAGREQGWDLTRGDVIRELPHLPRR